MAHIMPAAQRLQQTFNSWQDLQTNYLIGREFWSLKQTKKCGAKFQTIFKQLSEDPSSPCSPLIGARPNSRQQNGQLTRIPGANRSGQQS